MRNDLSILCLALAFCVAAPDADAGCGKLGKFNPFKKRKAACESPLESPAVSVTVAAPAVPVAATVGVLTYGAPFCAGGKCRKK